MRCHLCLATHRSAGRYAGSIGGGHLTIGWLRLPECLLARSEVHHGEL